MNDWKEHWKDMPEFVQGKQRPFSAIIVRFETEADLRDFEKRIGQKLTPKTKSIWHPYRPHGDGSLKVTRYVDES